MNPQYLQGIPVLMRLVYLRTLRRRIGLFIIIPLQLAIDGCVLSDNLNVNPNSIVFTFKALILWNYFALVLNGFSLVSVHNLERKSNQNYFICLCCKFKCVASWLPLLALGRVVCRWQTRSSSLPPGAAQATWGHTWCRDLKKEIIFKRAPEGFYLLT